VRVAADRSSPSEIGMLRVAIHSEGGSPKIVEFPYDQRVTFGRSDDNDIVLPPAYVSRQHGEFLFEDGLWWVIDRGSLTGMVVTRPDGERRQLSSGGREQLQGGEAIEILHTLLRVEVKPIEALVPNEDEWWEESAGTVATIASARMESVRGLQRSLASDSRKLETLFELAKDLNRLQSAEAVLHRIGTTVFEALPTASHFSVCVLSAEGVFEPHFGMQRGGEELPISEIRVSRSMLGWVAARRMAVLYRPGDNPGGPGASMVLQSVASAMAVPLHGARGPVGVLLVDNRTSEAPFCEADLNLMIVLASSAASALERARFEAEIHRMFNGFVEASVTAIESRDPATSGHSRRVADYTLALARAANQSRGPVLEPYRLTDTQLRELSYAALLHDFGKVGVPECVLRKSQRLYPEQSFRIEARFRELRALRHVALLREALRARDPSSPAARLEGIELQIQELGDELAAARSLIERASRGGGLSPADQARLATLTRQLFEDSSGNPQPLLEPQELEALCIAEGTLSAEERRAIESHVLESHRFLQQIPWSGELERIPHIVVAHHEKLDGSGYPFRLRAGQIPPQARILTVCDIFEAITSIDRPYRSAIPYERGLDELRRCASAGQVDSDLVDLLAAVRPWEQKRPS
jgi:3',5'-cyclic-nucleotide phosphodiesterase